MNFNKKIIYIFITILFVNIVILKPKNIFAKGETCPNGYVLTGTVCTKTEKAQCRSGSCWCPPGSNAKLEGNNCIYTAEPEGGSVEENPPETENCKDGYEWVNGTCMKYLGPASQRQGTYYCSNGTLVGTACYSYYIAPEKKEEKPSSTMDENSQKLQECETLLGKVDDKGSPAYYLHIVFVVLRYVAIILLVLLTVMDMVSAVASHDDDLIKKNANKIIKRLAFCVVIFLLPTVIEFLLQFITVGEEGAIRISTCNLGG